MTRQQAMLEKIQERKRLHDLNTEKLAVICHLTLRTMQRRMRNPGDLTLDELVRLEKGLKVNLLDTETLRDRGYIK